MSLHLPYQPPHGHILAQIQHVIKISDHLRLGRNVHRVAFD